MSTKLKGDIAEQAFILEAMKREYNILTPIGDRLPYDLVAENKGVFSRIQVKSAWFDIKSKNYVIDVRRSKTNRRNIRHEKYQDTDFDIAAVFIQDLNIWYIMPIEIFNSYNGSISFIINEKRQRKAKSSDFKESWDLLENIAVKSNG